MQPRPVPPAVAPFLGIMAPPPFLDGPAGVVAGVALLLLWTGEQRQGDQLVGDPLLIQETLVALTVARIDERESVLRLVVFDDDSGERTAEHDLVRLRPAWQLRQFCAAAPLCAGGSSMRVSWFEAS